MEASLFSGDDGTAGISAVAWKIRKEDDVMHQNGRGVITAAIS